MNLPSIGDRPARGRIDFVRGDDFPVAWTWRNKTTRQPYDLTGWSAELVFSAGGVEVLRLDTAGVRLVLGGAAGTIVGNISDAETVAIAEQGTWFFRLISPEGIGKTKASGPFVARWPG